MGEIIDKAKGGLDQAIGKGKEAIGNAAGDAKLEGEGKAQQVEGEAEKLKGRVKGALGDKV